MNEKYILLRCSQGKIKCLSDESFHYGDEVILKVSPMEISSTNDAHAFDEKMYMKSHHIVSKVKLIRVIQRTSHFNLTNFIVSRFSDDKTIRSYQRLFLLGMRDEEIGSDYSSMSSLSIVHMFALSGMHITILYTCLLKVLELLFKKRESEIVSKILLGIYVLSIPYSISLHRAYFMLVGKEIFKDKMNELDCLSILLIIHILYNPYVIFNISFIFSYFIYFIVIMTKKMKYSTVLIYLSGVPIILNLNYSINLISIFLIVLLEPFIKVFYIMFVISIILPIDMILLLSITLFKNILLFTSFISHYLTFSKPNLLFFGIFYYAYFRMLYRIELKKSYKKEVMLLMSLFLSFSIYSRYKIYTDVTMIDVGQGDCTLIRLPLDQGNFLIDTGGNTSYDVATSKVIPYLKSVGITRIDTVFISHYDYDHSGALKSLKKNFDVREIVDKPIKDRQIGPMKIESLTTNHIYSDANNNSNVLYITIHDYHYLFTGDLGVEGEEALYKKYGKLDVDVLKVGHHGSDTSSSVEFFEMIHPRIAMIGVGRHNLYGHPKGIILDRLKQRGIKILRTDRDGCFTIRSYGKNHYVYK